MEVYEDDDRLPDGDYFGIWIEPRRFEHEPSFNGIDWESSLDGEVIDFDVHCGEDAYS